MNKLKKNKIYKNLLSKYNILKGIHLMYFRFLCKEMKNLFNIRNLMNK